MRRILTLLLGAFMLLCIVPIKQAVAQGVGVTVGPGGVAVGPTYRDRYPPRGYYGGERGRGRGYYRGRGGGDEVIVIKRKRPRYY